MNIVDEILEKLIEIISKYESYIDRIVMFIYTDEIYIFLSDNTPKNIIEEFVETVNEYCYGSTLLCGDIKYNDIYGLYIYISYSIES